MNLQLRIVKKTTNLKRVKINPQIGCSSPQSLDIIMKKTSVLSGTYSSFFKIHPVFPSYIWKSVCESDSFMDFWHIIFDNIKIFWEATNYGFLATRNCSHPLITWLKITKTTHANAQQPTCVMSSQLPICNDGGPCCTRPKLLCSFDLFSWSFSMHVQ